MIRTVNIILFNMIASITQIFAHILHSPIWWMVSKMQCKALWKSPIHEEFCLHMQDRLKTETNKTSVNEKHGNLMQQS